MCVAPRVWAASKSFDVATILADDATIVEQHPVIVDLTQNFGQTSEKMVSTHLSDQQDTMCDDIIKQLESKVRPSVALAVVPLDCRPVTMSSDHVVPPQLPTVRR